MNLLINHTSMIPIYEQIVNCIINQIRHKQLLANDALPSVRSLAKELKISALTVKKAYDILEEQGYIHTVHGKGSYVAQISEEVIKEASIKEFEEQMYNLMVSAKQSGLTKEEVEEVIAMTMEELSWQL